MVTIIDVAHAAGVAPSTVSHVLNGKRPISQKTKDKVRDAIKALGYEPNPNAQALRSTSSGIIGFFASNITEVFSSYIIQGVEKITRERNCYLIFASGVEFNNDIGEAVSFLNKRRIDGLILSFGIRRRFETGASLDLDIPIVTVNARIRDDIPSIQPDNFEGGRQAAIHFLDRGARIPAIIGGPEDRISSEERIAGFLYEVGRRDVHFDPSTQLVHGDFSADSGRRCFEELMGKNCAIDSIFCANDYMAAGAINEALKKGFAIPERMKIIGYDNREFGEFWPVPISTFSIPLLEMGERSASTLLGMIHGEMPNPLHAIIPSTLIPRAST
jgi:LacI family transcriptional regulator